MTPATKMSIAEPGIAVLRQRLEQRELGGLRLVAIGRLDGGLRAGLPRHEGQRDHQRV
ncbi:hypothetical protein [Aeromicrobium sp.]|jgi:hypothetical protein|uniref:hypothetical protein n=1 Tax=Aeromicrobium sp. TaxID=1871063 RepID=UPI00261D2811|nr:hypothetical protein [Aeromicrobium sp.]